MINRALIRIKVVQMVYAYYQSDSKDLAKAEKEFFHSIEKAADLYHYLLQLIQAVTDFAYQRLDAARNKYLPSEEEKNPNTRFIDNAFVAQLAKNKLLNTYLNNTKMSWVNHEAFVKNIYESILASDFYLEYMNAPESSYEADQEIWRKIFKSILQKSEELPEVLEEQNIYWNDDLEIILTFVMKTIKRFKLENGANQELLPMFKDDEDRKFASDLFCTTIRNRDKYRALIDEAVKNWEIERLAMMDLLILQVALAEIMDIDGVPVNVSLNEYIDIAKSYSTQKSGLFVNGTLDHIVTELRKENKLFKS
ncbi:MAG TPA: transcription antitermination factor NusB [Bacteroidales bacterium]|nr:transcription antitermination factor NusB [Bacteroidales bacterium]